VKGEKASKLELSLPRVCRGTAEKGSTGGRIGGRHRDWGHLRCSITEGERGKGRGSRIRIEGSLNLGVRRAVAGKGNQVGRLWCGIEGKGEIIKERALPLM